MGEEKNFENKIKKFLKNNNIFYFKFFANGFTVSGIPDIIACKNGLFTGIEVKAENGKPSPLQMEKIDNIYNSGGFACIVYPSGFDVFKDFLLKNTDKGKYIFKNNKYERID